MVIFSQKNDHCGIIIVRGWLIFVDFVGYSHTPPPPLYLEQTYFDNPRILAPMNKSASTELKIKPFNGVQKYEDNILYM